MMQLPRCAPVPELKQYIIIQMRNYINLHNINASNAVDALNALILLQKFSCVIMHRINAYNAFTALILMHRNVQIG